LATNQARCLLLPCRGRHPCVVQRKEKQPKRKHSFFMLPPISALSFRHAPARILARFMVGDTGGARLPL